MYLPYPFNAGGQQGTKNGVITSSNPLDSFFPFDPCLLRMLHHSISGYYREFTGVPGLAELQYHSADDELDEGGYAFDDNNKTSNNRTEQLSEDESGSMYGTSVEGDHNLKFLYCIRSHMSILILLP